VRTIDGREALLPDDEPSSIGRGARLVDEALVPNDAGPMFAADDGQVVGRVGTRGATLRAEGEG
jgi:hypothetical protein